MVKWAMTKGEIIITMWMQKSSKSKETRWSLTNNKLFLGNRKGLEMRDK